MAILNNLPEAPLTEMQALYIIDTKPLECILDYNITYAATAAGGNGAINIWKDVHGFYRADVQRYCVTIDKIKTLDMDELKSFVNEWLKKNQ